MTEFHKLVRDKIPDIISENGETPHFRMLNDDREFLASLLEKDAEEGAELAEALAQEDATDEALDPASSSVLAELADKLEVLHAIAKTRGYTPEQIEQARLAKRAKRGGFEERIFLEKAD